MMRTNCTKISLRSEDLIELEEARKTWEPYRVIDLLSVKKTETEVQRKTKRQQNVESRIGFKREST